MTTLEEIKALRAELQNKDHGKSLVYVSDVISRLDEIIIEEQPSDKRIELITSPEFWSSMIENVFHVKNPPKKGMDYLMKIVNELAGMKAEEAESTTDRSIELKRSLNELTEQQIKDCKCDEGKYCSVHQSCCSKHTYLLPDETCNCWTLSRDEAIILKKSIHK